VAMTVMAADRGENRRPILVTGMHRSGTSWLGMMLCASGVLINVGEPLKPSNRRTIFRSKIPYWYNYITEANEGDFLGFYKDAVAFHPHPTHDLRRMRSPRDAFRLASRLGSYALGRAQKRRLLIKDPFAVFSFEWFVRRLDADIVIIIRHPAAVVSSLKRLGYSFDLTELLRQPLLMRERLERFRPELEAAVRNHEDIVGQGSLLWRMIYGVLDGSSGSIAERIAIVRHEDLSLHPLESFEALYERVDLPMTKEARRMIADFTGKQNPSEVSTSNPNARPLDSRKNISNWAHRLQADEINRIRELTEDVWPRYYSERDWHPASSLTAAR
jgi:Sulfotransferase family